MGIKIYYFTGTGNSLFTAKELSKNLNDSEIIPIIRSIMEKKVIEGDIIGIVTPVYMYRAPKIVCKFLKSIQKANYVFAVATNAGGIGKVFSHIKSILKKQKLTLNAGFNITLPNNYTPYGPPPEGDILDEIIIEASQKINSIAKIVKKQQNVIDSESSFYRKNIWPGIFYYLGYISGKKFDRYFKVGSHCNKCGLCMDICPVDNITLKNSRLSWKHKCENCFACMHFCPKEQIQFGKFTEGIKRYRNPYITVKEIINQK